MTQPYVAEIRVFGFQFAPLNFAFCNGSLMSISQNTTLFTLLGTTYGGDGVNTFGVPNMQDNVVVNQGQGLGLRNWVLGQTFGETNHTLLSNEAPLHTHQATAGNDVAFASQSAAPSATSYLGREKGGSYAATGNSNLAGTAIGNVGGSLPHSNTMPTLAMNYCIAQYGIFPSSN